MAAVAITLATKTQNLKRSVMIVSLPFVTTAFLLFLTNQ